jgi:hypothetical protein
MRRWANNATTDALRIHANQLETLLGNRFLHPSIRASLKQQIATLRDMADHKAKAA